MLFTYLPELAGQLYGLASADQHHRDHRHQRRIHTQVKSNIAGRIKVHKFLKLRQTLAPFSLSIPPDMTTMDTRARGVDRDGQQRPLKHDVSSVHIYCTMDKL